MEFAEDGARNRSKFRVLECIEYCLCEEERPLRAIDCSSADDGEYSTHD